MGKKDDVYRAALANKDVPMLVLDHKWYQLFTKIEKNEEITALEERLNELMRRQGKYTTQSKDVRLLKKKLMKDVVTIADQMDKTPDKKTEKKLVDMRRLIVECNEKFDDNQLELNSVTYELKKTNEELMLKTMNLCYDQIQENTEAIEEMTELIKQLRIELKKSVIRKDEAETENQKLYSYMHDIFGRDVIEIFDLRYDPGEQIEKKRELLRAKREAERRNADKNPADKT